MKYTKQKLQLLIVYLADSKFGKAQRDSDITELWNLVTSLGNAEIVDLIEQKGYPMPGTYIGQGKAEEIAEYLKTTQVDIIVFQGILTPTQKFNLTKMYWDINTRIKVWDRVDLILEIFKLHAHTKEALLQIELARMRHMGPTIFGMGMILSRQGAGIGTRGIGETNTELMKRHWKREMKRTTDRLTKLENSRRSQIENRKKLGLKTVSLVGYTNAGKTTLFNQLTHKQNYVDNLLFATLDSTVGEVFIPQLGKAVIISDTIGFIKDLPPQLIEAFTSTLLESISADIVLHVVDAADPDMFEKIDIVDKLLADMTIAEDKIILVFNKIDIAKNLDKKQISKHNSQSPPVFLSANSTNSLDELLPVIQEKLTTP